MSDISSWISSDYGKAPIYVLDGVAGIGKSTVSQTLAERAAEVNCLGASFFFSRNEERRKSAKSFFPTLAYQLALYDEEFARQITAALELHPDAADRNIRGQYTKLIAEPLQDLLSVKGRPVFIVIDALDECESYDAIGLLTLLAAEVYKMPRLKVFITTRPERHIRNVLARNQSLERFHLQDIEDSVVEADIRLYLDFRLSAEQVKETLPELRPPPWQPAEEQKKMLVGMSGKLFIVASTTARFILDEKRLAPAKQLETLLKGVSPTDFFGSKYTTVLDHVYMQIIRSAIPTPVDDWVDRYQEIVGTIIFVQDPLSCDALAGLLDIDVNDIHGTLSHLHSLIAPSGEDQTFRVHHKTFPDFVTDQKRCEPCPEIFIVPKAHHQRIAKRCLKIMIQSLNRNICDLGSEEWYKDNNQLQHRTRNCISVKLSYACTHWAYHLETGGLDDEACRLLERFSSTQLLAWLETLSVIGRIDTAYLSLDRIYGIIVSDVSIKLYLGRLITLVQQVNMQDQTSMNLDPEILYDGSKFVLLNYAILRLSPMHVYWSSFPFTPTDTVLFRMYKDLEKVSLQVVSGFDETWNANSVPTGHSRLVTSVSYSPDGLKFASASADKTVRVWDGRTGGNVTTLTGHSGTVNSVIFSADGSRLVSASKDKTIRLWDAKTFDHIATLEGHSVAVYSIALSTDSSRLASASGDEAVRLQDKTWNHVVQLWDGKTGNHLATLEGHSAPVQCVAFSPDGSTLVSASEDHTIRLWDGKMGGYITTLEDHRGWVNFVAYSSDGTRFASSPSDTTARLWDGKMGSAIASLEGSSLRVYSVAFSADSSKLASASEDKSVRVWDGKFGASLGAFDLGIILDMSFLAQSNYVLVLIERTQPVLRGLVAIKLDEDSSLDPMPLIWFSHNLSARRFVVDPTGSFVAVGCKNGRILLLDISQVTLP